MTQNKALARQMDMYDLFVTNPGKQLLYVDERANLKEFDQISLIAGLRLGEHYTTLRVPTGELRKLIRTLRQSKKRDSRNGVNMQGKPTPPGYTPTSQLTHEQRRKRFKIGFAPLRDWWPASNE